MLASALLLRAALAAFVFSSTGDTSVVGVMALQILEGARPLFYAGQNYMGALEAYAVAVVFHVFGISPFALAVVPTVFGVLWCWSVYALFRRLSGCEAGGLAAAACAAFGGAHVLWYTMGAYGGYPEMLLLGTLSLVLVYDLTGTDGDCRSDWWRWGALGGIVALGVWTNMQTLSYFLVAGGWLLADWWRRSLAWRRLVAMGTAGALGLLGFLPMLIAGMGDSAGETHMGGESLRLVALHAKVTLLLTLPPMVWRTADTPLWLRAILLASIALPVAAYVILPLARRWRAASPDPGRRTAWWVPAAVTVVFLVLYLPHPLAASHAPRYLIAAFTFMIGAGFATLVCLPSRRGRWLGWSLLAIWCGYNTVGTIHKCVISAPIKSQTLRTQMQIVAAARDAGLRHVKIIGGLADQLRGATLSMTRERDVRFLALQNERILEHQQGWERDNAGAYAFSPRLLPFFSGALEAMGVEEFTLSEAPDFRFLWNMVPPAVRLRQTSIRHIAVEGLAGEAGWLTDGIRSTGVGPAGGAEVHRLVIALEGAQRIGGMRLFPVAHDLPRGLYTIEHSLDGVNYIPVVTNLTRSGESYISGNRVYFKDFDPAQDHRWPPAETAYLRLTIDAAEHTSWQVAEIRVFEHLGDGERVPEREVAEIAVALEAADIAFVFADRWLSSRLEQRRLATGKGPRTCPPMNLRYPATMRPRVVFARRGQAVVVAAEMADEAEQRLRQSLPAGTGLIASDFGHYRLLRIEDAAAAPPAPPLHWNGHTLLQ